MKGNILLAVLLFSIAFTYQSMAHPGIGIVMDSKGYIYYTDLNHVWKISPDGSHSIAIENVHTHQLYLDEEDNLYGEHVWYEGEITDKWGHYIWRYNSNGVIDYLIPRTEGFPLNNMLVRDNDGNEYYTEKFGIYGILKKKTKDGSISLHAHHLFQDIRWIYASKENGTVYVIDQLALKKVTADGQVEIISDRLKESTQRFDGARDRHYVMGMWEDQKTNLYVAIYGAQKIIKLTQEGNLTSILEVSGNWSPSGGLFAPDGSLWTLEYSTRNQARVRKINAGTEISVFRAGKN